MKKVLITGVAGYIGSALCRRLLQSDYKVIGVDKLLYGGKSILEIINNPNFIFIPVDIEDINYYKKHISSDMTIVNLAAIVGEPASKKWPKETSKTNVDATRKLIDTSIKKKIKKFIFISTCSNYGKVREGELADEEKDLNPLSLYAETKVAIEEYLKNEVKNALDWTILRFATVYGMSPRPRFDLTVNDFTLHAIVEKKLVIYLPYSKRPYMHVIDATRAIQTIIETSEDAKQKIFNVGNTLENYRKIDIVEKIREVIKDVSVEFVDVGNDPRDYAVSFEKIKDMLGFDTTKKILDGVKEIQKVITTGIIKDYSNTEYYNA